MKLKHIFILLILGLNACNKIETNDTLDNKTRERIKTLGLLDDDETVIKFYSNYQPDLAGNFYTNKRIAHYWLDENFKEKSDTSYAFYQDIVSIDSIFKVPDTFAPYLLITKNDSSEFRVYVEGDHQSMLDFYFDAIKTWKKIKSTKCYLQSS